MQSKPAIPFITQSVRKFTILNVFLFLTILIILNVLLIYITAFVQHQNLDVRLTHEFENIKAGLRITANEIEIFDFKEFNEPDLKEITENPYFLQIYDNSDTVKISSANLVFYKKIPFEKFRFFSEPYFENVDIGEDKLRTGYFPLFNEDGEMIAALQLSVFQKDFELVIDKIISFNLIVFPFVIILVIILSIVTVKRAFSPINKIIASANKISAENLHERLEITAKDTDEIGRLRDTLNNLFDRVESHISELSQFTDHASHQLMNPLTALKTEMDYLLRKDRGVEEYKEAIIQLHDEIDNMISIVRTLLIIAKSSKTQDESKTIFNLSKLINNEIQTSHKLNNITYVIENDVYIRGDSEKFLMALNNLINNSIKYSNDHEEIRIVLEQINKTAELRIEDKGIGINDEDKEKVFQRFYRSETAEKLGIKGFGLGLSLVKSIVNEIHGTVTISNNLPRGTKIIIKLPAVLLTE